MRFLYKKPKPSQSSPQISLEKTVLGISCASLLLTGVLFYALSRNILGLEQEVAKLHTTNAHLMELHSRSMALDSQLKILHALPHQAKSQTVIIQLEALGRTLNGLQSQLNPTQQKKLERVRQLLDEILHNATCPSQ